MAPRVMKIPTTEEVAAYAASLGFKLDPDYFLDYWEQRGWKFKGGVPMVSWQATIRQWKRMETARLAGTAPEPQKSAADLRREEAAQRQAQVIEDHAGRIVALRSWLEEGKPCPFSTNPQEDIERIKDKVRDNYGPAGIDALRAAVIKLKRGGQS